VGVPVAGIRSARTVQATPARKLAHTANDPREAVTPSGTVATQLRELEQEYLERQTATNDVLRLISTSAFDLDVVFQSVITTATRLCRADHGRIYLLEDNMLRPVASAIPEELTRRLPHGRK
jgi:hypothetical protein